MLFPNPFALYSSSGTRLTRRILSSSPSSSVLALLQTQNQCEKNSERNGAEKPAHTPPLTRPTQPLRSITQNNFSPSSNITPRRHQTAAGCVAVHLGTAMLRNQPQAKRFLDTDRAIDAGVCVRFRLRVMPGACGCRRLRRDPHPRAPASGLIPCSSLRKCRMRRVCSMWCDAQPQLPRCVRSPGLSTAFHPLVGGRFLRGRADFGSRIQPAIAVNTFFSHRHMADSCTDIAVGSSGALLLFRGALLLFRGALTLFRAAGAVRLGQGAHVPRLAAGADLQVPRQLLRQVSGPLSPSVSPSPRVVFCFCPLSPLSLVLATFPSPSLFPTARLLLALRRGYASVDPLSRLGVAWGASLLLASPKP
eukprot:2808738-Rhodomonas_salina.2